MLKLLKSSFNKTNDCIILATPMILIILITQLYVNSFKEHVSISLFGLFLFYITLWIWLSGAAAGWFYMVKKALSLSDKIFVYDNDRIEALKNLFASLYRGVGRLFIPLLFAFAILFFIRIIIAVVLLYLLSFPEYVKTVTFSFMIIFPLFLYWFMFWIPEIVYSEKNPIKALVNSVKKCFITIKKSFLIYSIIYVMSIVLTSSLSYFQFKPLLYFAILIFSYYFILYSVILIFNHYEESFLK